MEKGLARHEAKERFPAQGSIWAACARARRADRIAPGHVLLDWRGPNRAQPGGLLSQREPSRLGISQSHPHGGQPRKAAPADAHGSAPLRRRRGLQHRAAEGAVLPGKRAICAVDALGIAGQLSGSALRRGHVRYHRWRLHLSRLLSPHRAHVARLHRFPG